MREFEFISKQIIEANTEEEAKLKFANNSIYFDDNVKCREVKQRNKVYMFNFITNFYIKARNFYIVSAPSKQEAVDFLNKKKALNTNKNNAKELKDVIDNNNEPKILYASNYAM